MSPLKEITGERDLGFSQWHRDTFGPEAHAFDIDLVARCNACGRELIAYEETHQRNKDTSWVAHAAHGWDTIAVLVVTSRDEDGNLQLWSKVCGGEVIGDADMLERFELMIRDTHHAICHPDLPTWVYRRNGRPS